MHMLKVKVAGALGMLTYDGREPGDYVNPETHGETLKPERTKDNYALYVSSGDEIKRCRSPHKVMETAKRRFTKAVERHVQTTGRKPRKDAVGLAQWCVTLPEHLSEEDAPEYFAVTLDLMCKRYGYENVLGGFVHMDESTPHMHAAVLMQREGRFQAKNIVCPDDLRTIHQDFEEQAVEIDERYTYLLDEDAQVEKIKSKLTQDELNVLDDYIDYRVESKVRAKTAVVDSKARKVEKRSADLDKREEALISRENAVKALKEKLEELRKELDRQKKEHDQAVGEFVAEVKRTSGPTVTPMRGTASRSYGLSR